MRFLLTLPGLVWLLLPPICICHLPERLAGNYSEAPRPEKAPENEDHAPGCPAAKRITPSVELDERLLGEPSMAESTVIAEPAPVGHVCRDGFARDPQPTPTLLFALYCLWLL